MLPKLVNKAYSEKSTQIMRLERHKEPYNTTNLTRNSIIIGKHYVCDFVHYSLPYFRMKLFIYLLNVMCLEEHLKFKINY